MELEEKEKKHLKRLTYSDRKTRKPGTTGALVTMVFSLMFFFLGIYFYIMFLPRFRMVQGAAILRLSRS